MARPAYSTLIADVGGVSGIANLGSPPDGYLWVVREVVITYGDQIGNAELALGLTEEGPWSWLVQSPVSRFVVVGKTSADWQGRWVVPDGSSLWVQPNPGLVCDLYISGYQLEQNG